MANVLPAEKQLAVLTALVNGASVRAAERITDVSRPTISRLSLLIGLGCARIHDRMVRDLKCAFVDLDEQHSWVSKRQIHLDPETDDPRKQGEQWTWASICRTSKLIIAWHVGKRDAAGADKIVMDTRARLAVMPQICTDGLALYEAPILLWFGYAVPYVQTVKRYTNKSGKPGTAADKHSHGRGVEFIEKRVIYGCPDLDRATTYAIERSNLTNRQWNARLHRRTLAFSKAIEHHTSAVATAFVYRNLCWLPNNMRETAAMAAGITDHVWSLEELMAVALTEPAGDKPKVGPLVIPKPATTARELPGDRGWLQVVPTRGKPAAPSPTPATPPAAPAEPSPAVAVGDHRQLDLFAWKPRPREVVQLTLFGEKGGNGEV